MLKAFTGAALLATALSTPALAGTPWNDFYLGGVGTVGVMSSDNNVNTSFFEGETSSLSDWGGAAGLTAGKNWQDGSWVFGVEGDFSWADFRNSNSQTFIDGAETEGYHQSTRWNWYGTLRARVGLDFDDTLVYATGGLAVVGVKNSASFTFSEDEDSETERFSESKAKLGIALGAGVERHFRDHWTFKAEFLYIGLPSSTDNRLLETEDEDGVISSSTCTSCGIQDTYRSSAEVFRVGINYQFNEPPPPAPPPPPPMAPKPVTTFIVFFDFNKSNLTAEAQSVVAEAVKVAKGNGFVKVLVTGHTDTVGSDSYNMGLSVRRAEAVKDEMVREGMDGSGIAIQGKSFHDPLVPTGPGVREPQNRRAVIDLGS